MKKTLSLLLTLAVPLATPAATICFVGDCASNVSVALSPLLDTTVAIPGGTGNFTSFPTAPSVSDGNLLFTGAGAGQLGIYLWPPAPVAPPNPIRVADLATLIPGGVGSFTAFTPSPLISGLDVTFVGSGAGGQSGVYFHPPNPIVPGQPVSYPPEPIRVADLATLLPGTPDTFTAFAPIAFIDGATVAFTGESASESGLFTFANGVLSAVLEGPTLLPSAPGSTTLVLVNQYPPAPIRIAHGNVAFIAQGLDFAGVYLALAGGPILNVASSDAVGTSCAFQSFSTVSYDGANVAFVAGDIGVVGDTNTPFSGVFKAVAPSPNTPPSPCATVADTATAVPGGLGTFLAFGNAVIDPNVVVFEGFSSDVAGGQRAGLYTDLAGKLWSTTSTLPQADRFHRGRYLTAERRTEHRSGSPVLPDTVFPTQFPAFIREKSAQALARR
jgi:hypothetical protein